MRLCAGVNGADWVVASGSLPPGVDTGFYRLLGHVLRRSDARIAIDTSGPALSAAVAAAPSLVKPNGEELAEATGVELRTVGDVIDAAQLLRQRGARTVLASLGRDGAVLVEDDGVSYGAAPDVTPASSVGAGDAMLAGFLSAGAHGPSALAAGLAWGSAAVALPGSQMPGPEHVDAIHVQVSPHPRREQELSAPSRSTTRSSRTEQIR